MLKLLGKGLGRDGMYSREGRPMAWPDDAKISQTILFKGLRSNGKGLCKDKYPRER